MKGINGRLSFFIKKIKIKFLLPIFKLSWQSIEKIFLFSTNRVSPSNGYLAAGTPYFFKIFYKNFKLRKERSFEKKQKKFKIYFG